MEQKLIDLLFEMIMVSATNPWFDDKSTEEIAELVREQLKANNIEVTPVGASHGYITGT